jgi:hypothetical protein
MIYTMIATIRMIYTMIATIRNDMVHYSLNKWRNLCVVYYMYRYMLQW